MKKIKTLLIIMAVLLGLGFIGSLLPDTPEDNQNTSSTLSEEYTTEETTEEETTTTTTITTTTTTTTTMFNDPDVEHTSKYESASQIVAQGGKSSGKTVSSSSVPAYAGKAYVIVNNNIPTFSASDKKNTSAFERYSNLDNLGRCGVAYANVCQEIMPTEPRGEIGMIKPSGWKTIRYDDIIADRYLYNRCHLIGYQLTAENANEKNLITGTRYMNVSGMLPFENMVADYVKETGNHVLYRSTPVFKGNELVARGVQIEAYSVEDDGDGICFNVYCFNIQPGIVINYADGSSQEGDPAKAATTTKVTTKKATTTPVRATTTKKATTTTKKTTTKAQTPTPNCNYIANVNSYKFHRPNCGSVKNMKESNKLYFTGSRDELIAKGYSPCKNCKP